MLWLRRAYIIYGAIVFISSFLVLFPFFWLCINIKPLNKGVVWVNQVWCWLFFPAILMPVITKGAGSNIPKGPVVFVANHTSYLDIAMLTWIIRRHIAFMGKAALLKVPLFGYYFRKIHISVDRRNAQDRNKALDHTVEMIRKGRSVVIFPEGRIAPQDQPLMGHFKDGAFRAAIRTGAPIVPITIAFNWYIMPDWGQWGARWHWAFFRFHEPIPTKGLNEATDVEGLKQQVFNLIDAELEARNPEVVKALKAKRAAMNALNP